MIRDGIDLRQILGLLFFVSVSLTYLHLLWIDYPDVDSRWDAHNRVINQTAPSPYRYRVLVPLVAEATGSVIRASTGVATRPAVMSAYLALKFFSLFLGLALFHLYQELWLSRRDALVGTLFVAAMMPLTFIHYYFQPTSHPEFISFILGMWLIVRERTWWFLAVLVVSTLNRETSVFLLILYLACNWGALPRKRLFATTSLLGATYLAIFAGLRLALGVAPHVGSERADFWTYRLRMNLTTWDTYLVVMAVFGLLWWLAYENRERKPLVLRRGLWLVPVFFLVYGLAGNIQEVRLFLELAPIVVPLGVMSLLGSPTSDPSSEPGGTRARVR